jgi:hypothetical protein
MLLKNVGIDVDFSFIPSISMYVHTIGNKTRQVARQFIYVAS